MNLEKYTILQQDIFNHFLPHRSISCVHQCANFSRWNKMVSNQFHSSEDRAYRVLDKLKLNFKSILRTAYNYFLMFSLSPSYSKESIPIEFTSSAPSSNPLVGNSHRQKALAESEKTQTFHF